MPAPNQRTPADKCAEPASEGPKNRVRAVHILHRCQSLVLTDFQRFLKNSKGGWNRLFRIRNYRQSLMAHHLDSLHASHTQWSDVERCKNTQFSTYSGCPQRDVPYIEFLKEPSARKGFLEQGKFEELVNPLPHTSPTARDISLLLRNPNR